MNNVLKYLLIVIVSQFISSIFYGSSYYEYNGKYDFDLATLIVKHIKVINFRKDEKTGKVNGKIFKKTTFSVADNKKKNLLKIEVIADGKSYVFKDYFKGGKDKFDPKKSFTIKGFPKTVTFVLHYSIGKISHPFNISENLKMTLDNSSIQGSHGKGKIIIENVK